jgi:hypothetical protein
MVSGERTLAHIRELQLAHPLSRRRHALADPVRLPTRALDTEAAQRTFDFGDTRSYPLEILTRE